MSRSVRLQHPAFPKLHTPITHPDEVPDYLSPAVVAKKLSVSRAWVHGLYKSGRLAGVLIGRAPGEKRGGVLRFKVTDVVAFIENGGGNER